SLRIAEAVRVQMAKTRQSVAQRPGPANVDSLRRTLVREYTDSALREARQAVTAAVPQVAPRVVVAETAVAKVPLRGRRVGPTPANGPGVPRQPAAPGGARLTTPAARPPAFARPRRVAI